MVAEKGFPSLETGHYFGTDEVGRDLYSRVIQGTQMSLIVGIRRLGRRGGRRARSMARSPAISAGGSTAS